MFNHSLYGLASRPRISETTHRPLVAASNYIFFVYIVFSHVRVRGYMAVACSSKPPGRLADRGVRV